MNRLKILLVTIFVLFLGILGSLGSLGNFATAQQAQYYPDLILTHKDAAWIDSRSATSLSDLFAEIGTDVRTILIARQEIVSGIVPSNITLNFTKDGSLSCSTSVIFETRNFIAPDRQIFYGPGDYSFAAGTVLRSSWFSSLFYALILTFDDEVTLKLTGGHETLTSDIAVGDNVTLAWESARNRIIVSTGVTLSNISKVYAPDFQLFSGEGDFDFVGGVEVRSGWFERVRLAAAYLADDNVTLTLSEIETVDDSFTIYSGLRILDGAILNINAGEVVTIEGSFSAGQYQCFTGSGTVNFSPTHIKQIFPQWWGAIINDAVDDTIAINAAITSAGTSYKQIYISNGEYLVSSTIIIPYNISLLGGGFGTVLKAIAGFPTTINYIDYNDTIRTFEAPILFFTNEASYRGLRASNLRLDGDYIAPTGLVISNGSGQEYSSIYARRTTYSAFVFAGVQNSTLTAMDSYDSGQYGAIFYNGTFNSTFISMNLRLNSVATVYSADNSNYPNYQRFTNVEGVENTDFVGGIWEVGDRERIAYFYRASYNTFIGVNFYGATNTAGVSICGIELGPLSSYNTFKDCSINGGSLPAPAYYPEVPAIIQRGYYNKFVGCQITHWGTSTLDHLVYVYGRTILDKCATPSTFVTGKNAANMTASPYDARLINWIPIESAGSSNHRPAYNVDGFMSFYDATLKQFIVWDFVYDEWILARDLKKEDLVIAAGRVDITYPSTNSYRIDTEGGIADDDLNYLSDTPDGTIITLHATSGTVRRITIKHDISSPPTGYSNILLDNSVDCLLDNSYDKIMLYSHGPGFSYSEISRSRINRTFLATIAAGRISVEPGRDARFAVDTQAAAAVDSLDFIVSTPWGTILTFHASSNSRTVIVRDGIASPPSGYSSIQLNNSTDCHLENAESMIVLFSRGPGQSYAEISRSIN